MRDVAIVGFAQRQLQNYDGSPTCAELLVPILGECYEQTGWTKKDVGFWCSGSSDYLAGRSFSFVSAIDAIGVLPPVNESHVEMDAAWALYEAWLKIHTGEVDTAVAFAFGKSSAGQLRRILALQLDPYTMTPLWPDTVSLAALQARAGIDAGIWDEAAMAGVVESAMAAAEDNPNAVRKGKRTRDELLAKPMFADPLRKHDCAPVTDGLHLGTRDLVRSKSAERAAAAAGGTEGVEVAELHAPFSHQELILRSALGLGDDVAINPSGGSLSGNPMFAGGAIRLGEAATRIWDASAQKTLGHATSGPALQQNLICIMEGAN
jgi:acetyl-CoA acetyltransferase